MPALSYLIMNKKTAKEGTTETQLERIKNANYTRRETLIDIMRTDKLECDECDYCTTDLDEFIKHEIKCNDYSEYSFEILKQKLIDENIFSLRKAISSDSNLKSTETATCDICDKVYIHDTKLLPKYALARHKKLCVKNASKHYKKKIMNSIETLEIEKYKDIMNFINKIKQN